MRILPFRHMPPSRQERRCSTTDPAVLTPDELAADERLGLENFHRYSQQSATGTLPPRPALHAFTHSKTARSQPQ